MNDLSRDFNAPIEVTDIRTKLRECHHVVVTGNNNSRYLETALAAITGMDYNYKRSVEMYTSSEWLHIDPKDIDLVVCRDPFGAFSYDESKAGAMADLFNSMLHSTKTAVGDKSLDIIIVTDLNILDECKVYHDHEILEEVVKVFTNTSLTEPADLTTDCRIQTRCTTSSLLPLSRNLGVLTENLIRAYKMSSEQVDKDILNKAKQKFIASKAIVLTGHKKCGKTSIAVALASSYDLSQCLLLKEPNDVNKIDFPNTCLVIIDEFAGKYRYEENDVYKWYNMFDHLYNAVIARKINVIITCEKSKFEKCVQEIARHAILEHLVDVPTQQHFIKQEVVESRIEQEQLNSELYGIKRGMKKQSGASVAKKSRSIGLPVLSVKETFHFNIRTNCDKRSCNIRGSCILPSGEIMLLDGANDKLKRVVKAGVNIHSSIICQLDVCSTGGVCYTGDNVAVVLSGAKLSFYDTADYMRLIRSVDIKDNISFTSLTCYDDKLYIRDDDGYIYIYSTDGKQQQILYVPPKFGNFFTNSIAISDDGSKLYVPYSRKLVTIDNTGKELFSLNHVGICAYSAVCVGNQGHVYVSTSKKCVLKTSADGTTIVRVIPGINMGHIYTTLYDRENSELIVAGNSDNINIYSLEK